MTPIYSSTTVTCQGGFCIFLQKNLPDDKVIEKTKEVELDDENQKIEMPDWIGREVTHDRRFLNVNLIDNPFSRWQDNRQS